MKGYPIVLGTPVVFKMIFRISCIILFHVKPCGCLRKVRPEVVIPTSCNTWKLKIVFKNYLYIASVGLTYSPGDNDGNCLVGGCFSLHNSAQLKRWAWRRSFTMMGFILGLASIRTPPISSIAQTTECSMIDLFMPVNPLNSTNVIEEQLHRLITEKGIV